MRRTPAVRAVLVLAAAALAACAGPMLGTPAGTPAAAPTGARSLGADLFPWEARTATYRRQRGGEETLRVEPSADGTVRWSGGAEGAPRRMDVRRAGESVLFSGGPDAEIELIRIGAAPGAEWTSGAARVRFEGWERVTVPAGSFDAARIRVETGPAALAIVETWWFAPGTGLVKLRSDRGGVFADEMSLVR